MKKYIEALLIAAVLFAASGCNGIIKKQNEYVTITLWHNYGGQMKDTMDEMIDEFNNTIGEKNGFNINVTSISGSSALHDKLTMAASGDPGAPELPDITTCYPKTAQILFEKNLLVNFEDVFDDGLLSGYVPRFLDEGRLSDNKLYVFPVAKSTEVLFVNTTIFSRFANDVNLSIESLSTFEGIFEAAEKYYEWSDNKTPEISGDGKLFFMADSLFNYAQIGCMQLGDALFSGNKLNFSETFYKVWRSYFEAAAKGHAAIFNGYASDLAKTQDIVCYTGSTAGVLFFSPTVTYSDNTTESADLEILPYPTFKDGRKVAIQRGGGMCIIKSTKKKEKMAALFIKWFTKPENNIKFISSTGYLPVTKEAYGAVMSAEIDKSGNKNIEKLMTVSREMQDSYEFYIPPLIDDIDLLGKKYEETFKKSCISFKEENEANKKAGILEPDQTLLLDEYNKFIAEFE